MPTFEHSPHAPPLDAPRREAAAVGVARRLQEAGYTAYWAGGCVRDMLLGRTPRDYDIATQARPEQVIALFPDSREVGRHFGVVIAFQDGFPFEIATFRRDHGGMDGRHPETVSFTTACEDAARRDFTINAMFFDPVTRHLLDWTGGQADLHARQIRCVGDPDRRFAEDHLRMLRAVRFAATLDFEIEPVTSGAIVRGSAHLECLSIERIRDEFTRILLEARRPGQALRLLDALGLLPVFLPEVSALKHQDQPHEFHPEGDVFTHTVMMLDAMASRDPALAYAVLLHDIAKPSTAFHDGRRLRFHGHAEKGAVMAETLLRRLRLPNRLISDVTAGVGRHMRFMHVRDMRRSTRRRLIGSPTFALELELHRLDCLASHGKLDNHDVLKQEAEAAAGECALPEPWIRGDDLLAMGVRPGRRIGRMLRAAYNLQLEGGFADRKALLERIRRKHTRRTGRG